MLTWMQSILNWLGQNQPPQQRPPIDTPPVTPAIPKEPPPPERPIMLILRGIAGHFAGRDWPRGALDEPSALKYAEESGYEGRVLDVDGATGADSRQTQMAIKSIEESPLIQALYGFSGGGYNVRHILRGLSAEAKARLRKVVVLGAPNNPPTMYVGSWELVYRTNPPTGHMDGPRALLAEKQASATS